MKPTLALQKFLLTSIFPAAMAISFALSPAHAATLYWDGASPGGDADGGDGTWNTASNWSTAATGGSAIAWNNSTPDAAVFGATGGTVTLGANRSASGITFNVGGYTIESNTLSIGTGGITQASGVNSQNIINSAITLSGSQTWTNNSNANFTKGPATGLSLGAHTLELTSPGGGSITISGIISGSGNLVVAANTFASTPSGASTYSGTTTINSGATLTINSLTNANQASALGNKGSNNVASNLVIDGGTLRLQVSTTNSDRLFTMGAGGATLEARLTGANAGQFKLTNTAALAYSGVGDRTLTLGGNSDRAGGSSIALAIGDVGGGNGIVSLVTDGHEWTVNGNNSYSGGTTVNAGTLTMGSATALGANTGSLTVNGGILNLGNNNLIVGNLTGTGGIIQGGAAGTRTLTIGNGDATGGDFHGVIADGIGTTAVTKVTNGTLTLSGDNTYTGVTNVNRGILRVNGAHTGGGTYTVAASGTLQGTGSTTSALNVSGVLSPGASVQSFASGTLGMLDGSTFEYEVDSSVAASVGADIQIVSGDLNFTGTVNLTFADLATSPTSFGIGTVFSLINYSGDWNDGLFTFGGDEIANGGEFIAGLNTWRLDYNATSGGLNFTGDHIAGSFVNITAIPEPTAALLGGLGTLLLLRRRR